MEENRWKAVWQQALGRPLTAADVEPSTWPQIDFARQHTMMDFAATLQQIGVFIQRSLVWWQSYDLLLTPTTGTPPPKLGLVGTKAGMGEMRRWGAMAMFANITGQPAASIPLSWTPDGMPIGTQLVADIAVEDLLVRVSAQLEQAQPWAGRIPPLSARGIA